MKIIVSTDENNVIRGYATIGGISGGQDIETNYKTIEEIPPLNVGFYKLIDGEIVVDENLKAQFEATQ